jgi:hypothetical protein
MLVIIEYNGIGGHLKDPEGDKVDEHHHEVRFGRHSLAIIVFSVTGLIYMGLNSILSAKFFMVFSPIFMAYSPPHAVSSACFSWQLSAGRTSCSSESASYVPSSAGASLTSSTPPAIQPRLRSLLLLLLRNGRRSAWLGLRCRPFRPRRLLHCPTVLRRVRVSRRTQAQAWQ